MENNNINQEALEADSFSARKFLNACLAKWKWFVISVVLITGLGVVYVYTRQPKYQRSMSILIKDQEGGGGVSDIANSFSSLGLVSSNTNVYNEMISLLSPAVMSEVVDSLDLDMNYLQRGFPHGTTLYGSNLPFKVKFLDVNNDNSASFKAEVAPDGKITMSKFVQTKNGKKVKYDKSVTTKSRFGVVSTPVGRVEFSPNPRFTGQWYDKTETINVWKTPFLSAVEEYNAKLEGDLADRDAEVIDLSITDVSKERADDILDMVLSVYTEKWINDKNRIAVATSNFISDRLALIEDELKDVDSRITDYKSLHNAPDLWEAGKLNLAATQDLNKSILETNNELSMARYVADYVKNPSNANEVIPMNTGGLSNQLEVQISNYNTLLLARNKMVENTSEQNPLVKDYDLQLKGMRESIVHALDTHVKGLAVALGNIQGAKGAINKELSESPKQSNYLRSEERQRSVKESLYLYLLQKREENELTQKFTADNTRVITPPSGPVKPVSPKKGLTIAFAFLLGFLIPGVWIYVQESSNTRIRSRKDLERMITPFIGEIPFVGKKKSWLSKLLFKKKNQDNETVDFVVKSGSRDIINESFRIVRSNVDFMTRGDKHKVIMFTSYNPGSGKSFISYNLCASFAIKGKKVLLIDCDLRHGSASQYVGMPSKGLSSYLSSPNNDWQKYVVPVAQQPGFFVLPIGHRPPNPAELLDNPKLQQMIEEAAEEYDFVFLDCPPVDIVVDTQILSPFTDRTIFVVRAGVLEKSSLGEIDNMYKEGKLKGLSVLINATDAKDSRYGGSRGYYGSAYDVKE